MTIANLKHLLTIESLKNEEVMQLIERAQAFKAGETWQAQAEPVFVANLFFEDSTRTHKSFEVAEHRLGLNVIPFETATSSINKGESLYDTILTLSALGVSACVIRHPEEDYYHDLIESPTIRTAIINGGDGSGQHPSQCLLDMMTIYEEFGTFKGLTVGIVGDLNHSRVAKSNMALLRRLGVTVYFSGPREWFNPKFEAFGEYFEIDELVKKVDVLMSLRVQHERHNTGTVFSKESYHEQYGLTVERSKFLKPEAIIMHPAPVNRDVELADELVESLQSRIVSQMTNGVFMRMAILESILEGKSL
ncbi:aspartate carbamoyltransferase catalytic subunit [Vagococcus sp. PNs007]|uniref:Aspartate carbamoyltransferase n=1 Tax=Vagococcus proximus TaxID=2991417 RepID=A0ABT5WYV5_9ENTE|nr:aspartate carbamoyltransferase catalytic subunit [Vagococcus proximus]MDF0478899.1 aspartate carbamoyltransferase catalytic subunit [Vagococcus proximus]